MAQPPEDKKPDFSSLPRGAIGIKGFPVSRNTRLPSIRSPRDLTLVTLPKKTYMPNIPVRKEKKPVVSESVSQPKKENVFDQKKNSPQSSDRGRGRGRNRAQIIQTAGAIFSEGIAQDSLTRKEKIREAYQKSDYNSISRGISVKKEKDCDVGEVNRRMENLFRDDFIDDGDDDDDNILKPTFFPMTVEVKKETKNKIIEPAANFNPNIAKEMGFDVNQVAKFIKKEKDMESEEKQNTTTPEKSLNGTEPSLCQEPVNDIKDLLNPDTSSSPKLVLLQFPEFIGKKIEDSELSHKQTVNTDPRVSDNQTASCAAIKSLPEGYIGKLRVMKSGKVKFVIGSVELSLGSIDSLRSKHEVVSIRTGANSGDLDVLGYLEHKLKFVPDEDSIIS